MRVDHQHHCLRIQRQHYWFYISPHHINIKSEVFNAVHCSIMRVIICWYWFAVDLIYQLNLYKYSECHTFMGTMFNLTGLNPVRFNKVLHREENPISYWKTNRIENDEFKYWEQDPWNHEHSRAWNSETDVERHLWVSILIRHVCWCDDWNSLWDDPNRLVGWIVTFDRQSKFLVRWLKSVSGMNSDFW